MQFVARDRQRVPDAIKNAGDTVRRSSAGAASVMARASKWDKVPAHHLAFLPFGRSLICVSQLLVGDQHMPLSDGARKLLKHFQDKHLQPMEYEYPQVMRDLFGDAESCEKAQAELARVGLLELGMPRLRS